MSTELELPVLTPAQEEAMKQKWQAEEQAKKELQRSARALFEEEEDLTVTEISEEAKEILGGLQSFKNYVFDKLDTLKRIIKESERDTTQASYTFKNKEGNFKIEYATQGVGEYDARSTEAVALISEFVLEKYADDEVTKELVMSLLEKKNGNLDPKLVQKLYAMEDRFENEKWKRGLALLRESYKVNSTKSYVRFFEKVAGNAWQGIKLDFAVLPVLPVVVETVEADEVETEEGGADDASL